MTTRPLWRTKLLPVAFLGCVGLLAAAACGSTSSSGTTTGALASSQVLHFPVFGDPGTWDPGEMDS